MQFVRRRHPCTASGVSAVGRPAISLELSSSLPWETPVPAGITGVSLLAPDVSIHALRRRGRAPTRTSAPPAAEALRTARGLQRPLRMPPAHFSHNDYNRDGGLTRESFGASSVQPPTRGGWMRGCARALVVTGVMGLALACQSSKTPPGITTGDPGGGTSGGGGAAGEGGTAGRDGTGATGGSAGAGGTTGIDAVDSLCSGAAVFWATSLVFQEETPAALATEFNILAAQTGAHPITIVLVATGSEGEIATSATELAADGLSQAFPAAQVPDTQAATLFGGGFRNDAPQTAGWLRFQDQQGSVDIALTNVGVDATSLGGCSSVSATLTADIPASQAGVSLDLASGVTTVGALGGGAGPWPISAEFRGESIDFDFEALPDD
jgi:hypothetical protein